MTSRELQSDSFGSYLLLSLPEDVFALLSSFLSPTDVCNLTLCCKTLCDLVDSDKIWLVQCELIKALPLSEIVKWRVGVSSYKALRFLVDVMKPLVGVWVHRNPELGNVVYVMSGFLSVVGCRIIPQKVGPLGIQEGLVMWSPVFEIICGFDGSTKFFLHGRDGEQSCVYPGFVTGIDKSCNVLLLEVEPRREKSSLCSEIKREDKSGVEFQELVPGYRRDLLELVTSHVGLQVLEPISGKLFPSLKDDEVMFLERRTMLLKMHKFGGNWNHMNLEEDGLCYNPTQVDINEIWKKVANYNKDMVNADSDNICGINDILGTSSSSRNKASRSEKRRSDLKDFISSGDTFGLSLRACNNEVSFYEGWPIIPKNIWALYKLPNKNPGDNQGYAGLWGGTFGWPPGSCIDDETENAFYLLMLTYEESQEDSEERLLIGTKILEGTRYVDQPNGSAMFVVNINTPSLEPFPFDADGRDFEHTYTGNGISDGYGFRYPGSKPGSLYVISDDLLAFVWHDETEDVFTLHRVNLEEILKKGLGLCVPPLPPTNNFTYMDFAYTNVFTES